MRSGIKVSSILQNASRSADTGAIRIPLKVALACYQIGFTQLPPVRHHDAIIFIKTPDGFPHPLMIPKMFTRTRKSVISSDIRPATISGGMRKLTQETTTKRPEGK
jgi:hypothetical protein